jgi:cell division protease FtsH
VLFHGPPGTGKTMIARALANESGCDFIKVVASEFQEMFVGVGAKRVRELFASARSCPSGCIIFVDEIDALGSRLNPLRDSSETTNTINQFLSEMDGFSPTDRIVIVAATNRIDLVDYAILRAGRFDLKVHIDLPARDERRGIFGKIVTTKCRNYEIASEVIDQVADRSEAWSGADLENLINEAIYRAIRQKSDTLRGTHVLQAMDDLQPK